MEPVARGRPSELAEGLAPEPAPLLAELHDACQQGRLGAEEVLRRHPEVAADHEVVLRLLYEEVCLRQEAGQAGATAEVFRRFPQYQAELEVLLACHRLLQGDEQPAFPEVGEQFGEFRLRAELGRGARGRVFLASQPALADRPLVLKLTPQEGEEHLALARLQHAHIVPLYFVVERPERDLLGLCMPYVGGLSLGALLHQLREVAPGVRTGQHLLDGVRQARPAATLEQAPPAGPVHRFLSGATFAQAMCWVGACLADALQYAHERDLLHLDLKPDNVLLAADGQPMLLDFHLARAPLAPGALPPDWVGGTPGYMAPEQEAALAAVRAGDPVPAAVDTRTDVYGLGALLYEALGGPSPRPQAAHATARALRRNPQVSVGLADIVGRCLEPSAGRRYADAAGLAADLRRHLADRPLEGVANRSLAERWRKWRRRRRGAAPLGLALAAVLAVAAAAWGGLAQRQRALSDARHDLAEGQGLLRQRRHDEAARVLHRGQARLRRLAGAGELPDRFREELSRAERGLLFPRPGKGRAIYRNGPAGLTTPKATPPRGPGPTSGPGTRREKNRRSWASGEASRLRLPSGAGQDLLDKGAAKWSHQPSRGPGGLC
jgi:hypothetical protein